MIINNKLIYFFTKFIFENLIQNLVNYCIKFYQKMQILNPYSLDFMISNFDKFASIKLHHKYGDE